ncbi:hypothetical protein [Vibrio metschnikovii]|uniref:hypothetical protein n=1 Tax=Vibrio metschnikovii TaxID=28172 RepID=UPI00164A6869|nr:hypothetical protein [Vibrio metschnikovii]MBC5830884.1 hypothetical protein [Vibrio metschnikovii]
MKKYFAMFFMLQILPVYAGYSLSPISIDIIPSSNGEHFVLQSQSDSPLYITSNLVNVVSPATENENENEVSGVRTLKLFPDKFILHPHQKKKVQLINLRGSVDTVEVYRAYFTSVPYVEDEGSSSQTIISYSMGGIVRLIPDNTFVEFIDTSEGIKNNGNVHYTILKECIGKSQLQCTWQEVGYYKNIYPGQVYQWRSDDDESVYQIEYEYVGGTNKVEIKKRS